MRQDNSLQMVRFLALAGILSFGFLGYAISGAHNPNAVKAVAVWCMAGGAIGVIAAFVLRNLHTVSPRVDFSAPANVLSLFSAGALLILMACIFWLIPNIGAICGIILGITAIGHRLAPASWRLTILTTGCLSLASVALFGGISQRNTILSGIGVLSALGGLLLVIQRARGRLNLE